MKRRNIKVNYGFTLIEVMVVVVILSILATLILPNILGKPDVARKVKVKNDIRTIESALNLYRLDNFNYPSTEQGLQALVTKPSGSPEPKFWDPNGYLSRLPEDPWGNPYIYKFPGEKNPNSFDIISYGSDGQPGGENANEDIGNWELK